MPRGAALAGTLAGLLVAGAAACRGRAVPSTPPVAALSAPADSEIPADSFGAAVRRGLALLTATHDSLPAHVGNALRCTSCHSQIVQGNHMAVTEFTCFLCHFYKKVGPDKIVPMDFCLQCHNYPQSYINAHGVQYNHKDFVERGVICWRCHSDVVRGSGTVEDRACLQCHSDPEQLSKIGDVEQVHINHVTRHKVECFDCHSNIEHALPVSKGAPQINCTSCHQDTHLGPPQLYSGTGGRGVSAARRFTRDAAGWMRCCNASKSSPPVNSRNQRSPKRTCGASAVTDRTASHSRESPQKTSARTPPMSA